MNSENNDGQDRLAQPKQKLGGRYAHYVLFVLVIVYVFNFIDRNILSILNEEIQADLGVSDADMGLLMARFSRFFTLYSVYLWRGLQMSGFGGVLYRLD